MGGGIAIVEILYSTNIIALVAGGEYPVFSENRVIIWDEIQSCVVCEITFNYPIKKLKLNRDL